MKWLVMFALIFSSTAFGKNYTCKKDKQADRTISVQTTEGKAPCKALYSKDVKSFQVLWDGKKDVATCEKKAEEFSVKLAKLGWQCAAAVEVAPVTPAKAEVQSAPVTAEPKKEGK